MHMDLHVGDYLKHMLGSLNLFGLLGNIDILCCECGKPGALDYDSFCFPFQQLQVHFGALTTYFRFA